ncbi:ABC-type branched-chain amino acid transport system, permease component [Desulfosporosinus orientis DSM 765]|uniref:ABC-type branched-chain amino acid transport system, permease component n=1 Tax=Desulfosporosinus orientis (strain ATCC 19365 / DSM 765 / NCIMB 8382 / VKM B-1628 / Singapore I) TaxID=768706 RepID=G7WI86_DESOD|nr:branched-chain amino acid ABC transporter permease [Desulfosporosinus orientis]AET68534.1 ABC-type branched-chain amino acid transport system, permease component [Desulfosporosinus orientis DSM 765]
MIKSLSFSPRKLILSIVSLVVLGVLPYLIPSFQLRIATGIMMWIGLALSWNMLGGYMGYISFGHGASFGLGAYITGLLMTQLQLPFFIALLIAGILTYIFAVLVGYPTLRLSGSYFAIGTWAFAEMMRQLVLVINISGGPEGMRLPPMLDDYFFYFVMLGLALLVFIVAYFFFENHDFGLKVKAVREEETAARTLGLNTTWIKNQVFSLSSMFAGIIGGAYAYWITFIHPDSVLGPLIADQMVIMVLLGGIGTLFGPVIGAIVLYVGNQYMLAAWGQSSAYLIILGVAICLVILFLPEGLLSLPKVWKGVHRRVFTTILTPTRKSKV